MDTSSHIAELQVQAERYLAELTAAAAAAHERLQAGVSSLRPSETLAGEVDSPSAAAGYEADPIFATREFAVPPDLISTA